MTEAEDRAAIVAEAREWLGTGYHEHAAIKGVATDCAMLPYSVALAVGKIPAGTAPPEYSSQSMLHEDAEHYLGFVRKWAREIDREHVLPGDLAIFRYGRSYSHGAIIVDMPEVIHAVIRGRGVILGNMDRDDDLASRKVRFFTLF